MKTKQPYVGKKHYRDAKGSGLWIPPVGERDKVIHYLASRRENDSLAARAVLESLRARRMLGGCISSPGCLGALLSESGAFPARVRPNRHHRRRFPVDKAPEKRGWFLISPTSDVEHFKDGAPAVITRMRIKE